MPLAFLTQSEILIRFRYALKKISQNLPSVFLTFYKGYYIKKGMEKAHIGYACCLILIMFCT